MENLSRALQYKEIYYEIINKGEQIETRKTFINHEYLIFFSVKFVFFLTIQISRWTNDSYWYFWP